MTKSSKKQAIIFINSELISVMNIEYDHKLFYFLNKSVDYYSRSNIFHELIDITYSYIHDLIV